MMTTETPEFVEFASIPRLKRGCCVTEKIDGTNSCVYVPEDDGPILAGSRSRWIQAEPKTADNYGFARWVADHVEELRALGPGRHYGEWWGSGIQRRYGLTGDDKRWSLFNVGRWRETPPPACCHLVPVLYEGPFSTDAIDAALAKLAAEGSAAAPGFMKPEGVVIYLPAS